MSERVGALRRRAGGCLVIVTLALGLLGGPRTAMADDVDDAYAAGSAAAAAGDWAGAVEHWQRTLELLPGRSAELEYDLGTAYAQLGELGWATFHLERALRPELKPSIEVAELARRNLGIVRQQAEVQAEVTDAELSPPETWWDLFVVALASRTLGWTTLVSAWLFAALLGLRWWKRDNPSAVVRVLLILTGVIALGGGALHAGGLEAVRDSPEAIALAQTVEVREGPGAHVPVAFRLQGGSHVRVLETRAAWTRIRVTGGLEGWAASETIGRLDLPPVRTRVRAAEADEANEAAVPATTP